jgi:peptide/nickel transport system permease protein
MAAAIAGISVPSFFMAIIIAWLLGFVWSNITGLSMTGSWKEIDFETGKEILRLDHLILPAITLGIRPLAIIAQLTRSLLLEEMQKDYIQTAFAKGLKKRRVVMYHALRNAMNPLVTAISGWLAELLTGAFFVEYIFGWKGLGKMTVDAVEQLDYPLVMGSVLVSSVIFISMGIIADMLYARLDPRVRMQ